jgi:hypothetical protein
MNKEELKKVQMASIQLILKVDGEKMEVKIMTFGEESLPAEQRHIVEATAKALHEVFCIAREVTMRKEQA